MKDGTRERDLKVLARPSEPDDFEVVGTSGSHVLDARGRKYVDFTSGWNVGNIGWGQPAIRDRLARFNGPDFVEPDFLYRPWVELAELLVAIMPGSRLTRCFRATTGTEAVEVALQAAQAYTGRREFLSLEGSYHGNSLGAKSVGASEFRKHFPGLLPGCRKVEPPLDARAAARIERILERKKTAAFIMEPVVSALALAFPEREFIGRVAEACRTTDTVLIMDEISMGFGRTGAILATQHLGIEPDIVCLGKAITGGYAPLAATVTTEKIARSMRFEDSSADTYAWHPRSVEAALANLQFILERRQELLGYVRELGQLFRSRLLRMSWSDSATVRGVGLAIAIDFDRRGPAERLRERCREGGLLVALTGEKALGLFPALTLPRELAEHGLDILERCALARRYRKGA